MQISLDDLKEIMSDTSALVAERDALQESLTSERKLQKEVNAAYEGYKKEASAQIETLKDEAELLNKSIDAKNRQIKSAKRQRGRGIVIGLVAGIVIGVIAAK